MAVTVTVTLSERHLPAAPIAMKGSTINGSGEGHDNSMNEWTDAPPLTKK